jgi:type IV pilus biogenesis protein CpaD/CtpE
VHQIEGPKGKSSRINRAILAATLILLLAGCTTPIEDIQEDPQKFLRKRVTVRGVVERSIGVPLTNYSVFILRDETDRAVVFSATEYRRDSEVTITGRVIALPQKESRETAEHAIDELRRFLVESDLAEPAQAKRLSGAVVKVVGATLRAVGKGFFIVEEGE